MRRRERLIRREQKRKLRGPWRNIHGAIWLIGLAILALKGWWWPGILFLIAASMLVEAVIMQVVPNSVEEDEPDGPAAAVAEGSQTATPTAAPVAQPVVAQHRAELLPLNCPKCGGPTRGNEVKWTGAQTADCPFCGSNLPMGKG
jgi:hypothetical protein